MIQIESQRSAGHGLHICRPVAAGNSGFLHGVAGHGEKGCLVHKIGPVIQSAAFSVFVFREEGLSLENRIFIREQHGSPRQFGVGDPLVGESAHRFPVQLSVESHLFGKGNLPRLVFRHAHIRIEHDIILDGNSENVTEMFRSGLRQQFGIAVINARTSAEKNHAASGDVIPETLCQFL
ncbi:hypothetical protein SDC9_186333 [bioreactor metagenome]|uniref:Uncharacterized protein n=1 Tax=bioreactor metagenome TaxID=1076179 RepID=A0A645HIG6_9ZZZZ